MIQMGVTNSLQVCMDATHWLEHDELMDTTTTTTSCNYNNSPSSSLIMERRLRPQHEQPLKCPRCDSAHTKFCYYNNYSLSQPRYFCKTCRRYWTKGGTLRSIPVGGGCRKNKKVSSSSSKKPIDHNHPDNQMMNMPNHSHLKLSLPHDHMHFTSHINTSFSTNPSSFMEAKFGSAPAPIDFMDSSKLEALVGSKTNNNYDFMGNNNNNVMDQGQFGHFNGFGQSNFNFPNFGIDQPSYIMEQQMSYNHGTAGSIDVKPNPKNMLMLEWQDQNNCAVVGTTMMMMSNNYIINGYNNFSSSSWNLQG